MKRYHYHVARSMLALGAIIRTFAAMICTGVVVFHYITDIKEHPWYLLAIISGGLVLLGVVFWGMIWSTHMVEKAKHRDLDIRKDG